MTGTTLSVAIAVCILILVLRPVYALIVYLAVIIWYPTYLVVSLGTVDITAHRIVASVLLLKCLANANLRGKFKWCRLDTWVTVFIVVCTVVTFLIYPFQQALENRGGSIIDTWFLYLGVRLCITNRTDVLTVAKWISILLIPLAILGVVEAYTGYQPFVGLAANAPWALGTERGGTARFGLTRAIGPNGHAIIFGLCFTTLLPVVYYLRHERNNWRTMAYLVSGLAIIGALSSVSSGPFGALMAVILCLAMEPFKKHLRTVLIGLAGCVMLAEVGSNRPVYHVILSFANPFGGAWWHRARLIDCAIEHFGEWYLLGYGGRDPGWGPQLGMGFTDVCNQFVLMGVMYGVWGLIVFCFMLATAVQTVTLVHNSSENPMVKSLAWALGSIVVSSMMAFFSVALMGQSVFLFYFVLGMVGSLSNMIGTTAQGNNSLLPQVMSMQT